MKTEGNDDEEEETPDSESLITNYPYEVGSLSHLTKFLSTQGTTEAIEHLTFLQIYFERENFLHRQNKVVQTKMISYTVPVQIHVLLLLYIHPCTVTVF